ncbi:MFS transporter [Actinomadura sp. NBRC 104412]|uniref:MFS transporter n=1 Tax=Actinomadura sp. NBRC 104412 TaxID=3032203 RepID=UPI002552EE0D|nr:MFS transporter [Actinomadura sp. NBRC 104412]
MPRPALPLHLTSATFLRISAEGVATALVLTVQARTGRAADAGFLQAALTFPYVVSGPVIGHALDRASRPRAVAVALAVVYAASAGLLLLMAGRSPLVLAVTVAAVVGCTEPIVVGLTSLLPRFVPESRLPRAYGLEASSYSMAAVAGPGLAAAIATVAGGSRSGLAIVGAGAVGAAALSLLPLRGRVTPPGRPPQEPDGRGRPWLGVVVGGLAVLVANRVLRSLTLATSIAFLGYGGVPIAAVLIAQRSGADAEAGGLLLMAFALGALLGSLASTRWLKAGFAEWVVMVGLVVFGAALASVALAGTLAWALLCFLLVGLVEGPVFAATLMLRQRESPPERLGQVNTTGGSLKIGASAVGAALTGVFADSMGPTGLILAIAACQVAGALAGGVLLVGRPVRRAASRRWAS